MTKMVSCPACIGFFKPNVFGKVFCDGCNGNGYNTDSDGEEIKCLECGGSGFVRCPMCHGTTEVPE